MNRVANSKNNVSAGFTIIELLLAMTFVSFLLLTIALTVVQISTTYNKGMTNKDTNQVIRSLDENFEQTVGASKPFAISAATYNTTAYGGRLCLGQYSYIWNFGRALVRASSNPTPGQLNLYETGNNSRIRLVKAVDPDGEYCIERNSRIDSETAVEILPPGDHDIVLHRFSIISPESMYDQTTGQRLYSIAMTVGTNDRPGNVTDQTSMLTADASGCKEPNVDGSDLAYCAVQQFTLVLRAGNQVK